jgi:hypothetical protein
MLEFQLKVDEKISSMHPSTCTHGTIPFEVDMECKKLGDVKNQVCMGISSVFTCCIEDAKTIDISLGAEIDEFGDVVMRNSIGDRVNIFRAWLLGHKIVGRR